MVKLYTFRYEKLVRDKVADLAVTQGGRPRKKILSFDPYLRELRRKIKEEAEELQAAGSRKESLTELADLQELIVCLLAALKISPAALLTARRQKNKMYGSFRKRIYIKHLRAGDDFGWLDYHLNNPKKLPLIK